MGMSGQQLTLAILYPLGKTAFTLYRRLGGPQGQSGQVENLTPPRFDSQIVQPVAQSV